MSSTVLHESIEKKGTFRLTGDLASTLSEIKRIPGEFEEWNDLSEGELENNLSEAQKADMAHFMSFFTPEFDWTETFNKIPRKANGTFYKGRVLVLSQGHEFSWESEEEYGRRGPELRIKTYSDTEAELEFHSTIIEKW